MKYKDILVKVREREEEIDFLKRCKRVFVCPHCGDELDFFDQDMRHTTSLQCQKCKGIWG